MNRLEPVRQAAGGGPGRATGEAAPGAANAALSALARVEGVRLPGFGAFAAIDRPAPFRSWKALRDAVNRTPGG